MWRTYARGGKTMQIETVTPSRRAALGVLAGAGALALPAAVMAASTPVTLAGAANALDAELFALIAAAREAEARFEAATKALEEAEHRTEEVPAPQALIVTEEDTRLFWKAEVGSSFRLSDINWMKQQLQQPERLSVMLAREPGEKPLDEQTAGLIRMFAAREARMDQVIAAYDQSQEERKLAKERSGERAVTEWQEQLCGEMSEARQRVGSMRARTLAGMLAKLAIIAPEFEDEDEWASDVGPSERVLISVAADYRLGVEGVNPASSSEK
jgi:hypothetical protein